MPNSLLSLHSNKLRFNIVPNVASLVALSNLGIENEAERTEKKPMESPHKIRRPLEKSKTTLLAHTESSGQFKPPTEGRHQYMLSFV